MNQSERFYHDLPAAGDFAAALSFKSYRPAPPGWIIAMTDVIDSTVAINQGRYKDVTIAGAVGTIALANLTGDLDFPFVFGGDGMVFLLPGSYRETVLDVLADTTRAVRELSGLTLRAGVMTAKNVYDAGKTLLVGKLKVSGKYTQALLSGNGVDYADQVLKGRIAGDIELATEERLASATTRADYRGFSCRWLDIPSAYGETLSLIIRSRAVSSAEAMEHIREASRVLSETIQDETAAHPLTVEMQSPATPSSAGFEAEARFRSGRTHGLWHWLHALKIRFEIFAVKMSIRFNLPLRGRGKTLRNIPGDNIQNSDVRKFDGTLKMTLALTTVQRGNLIAELDRLETEGKIVYGEHISDRAIMTCLIHTNQQDEVHFVDAADGGYALAAKRMKEKLGLNAPSGGG